jgi:hypothetical protein
MQEGALCHGAHSLVLHGAHSLVLHGAHSLVLRVVCASSMHPRVL